MDAHLPDPMDDVLRAAGIDPRTLAVRTRRPRRRRRWIVAVFATLLVLATAAGVTAYARAEHSTATKWQDRAGQWQHRASEIDARLTSTNEQLRDTRAEVRAQEARISELASEKAQVTDESRQLEQIVTTVPSVTGSLRRCVEAAFRLSNDLAEFVAAFPNGSTAALDADTDTANAVCNEAGNAADTLDEVISGVTR
jgi:TolA-binding protein